MARKILIHAYGHGLPPSLSLSIYSDAQKGVSSGLMLRPNKLRYQPEKAASPCSALLPVMELF